MARLLQPDPATAARLADLGARAFGFSQTPWTAADFERLGEPPQGAILTDDMLQAGLIVLQLAADEAEILNLGVIPSCRRAGLAAELLRAAEELAKACGAKRMFLEVSVENSAARALYEKSGYTQVGERPGYYLFEDGSRTDAVVLTKTL
ncbi:MAG: GNAT family N-acetyltransferase [Pseudomonadota bacterium]